MSNKNPIKRILAVLKMPKHIGDKIIKAQTIQSKLTGNVNFPLPYPANIVTLAQLGADITALVAAETAVKNKTGTSQARDAIFNTVQNDLRNIMTMVQNKADSNTANSETIIIGAGYDIKNVAVKQKQQDAASDGTVSGTVMLTASGGGAHEWQMSKDQINITNLPSTSKAKTSVSGLTAGDIWYFRNRPILKKNNMGDWTAWFKLLVR